MSGAPSPREAGRVQMQFDDNTLLPKAIKWAAEHGAKVINVSARAPDTTLLQQAVKVAQQHDALIVAAAGNVDKDERGKESAGYPANYPGVLSVAAVDQNGTISDFSNAKRRAEREEAWRSILPIRVARSLSLDADPSGWVRHTDGTACDACDKDCKRLGGMEVCVAACERCAASCREMAIPIGT